MEAKGDLIAGRFVAPDGQPLVSKNPARIDETVLATAWDPVRIDQACAAAASVAGAWAKKTRDERYQALVGLRAALQAHASPLADAIVQETGKLRAEAVAEVASLVSRFELARSAARADLVEGAVPGFPGEELRYHPLGVVGIIGPFNYPLHLCHAHLVPALLMGNAVVVKPSEVTPLAAQAYAAAVADSGLPPGLINIVQGRGESGARLVANASVRGLCFTGSYAVGRQISAAALDRPELLVALEMGGKNTVVVGEDADIPQAAHEIVVGGYLTTGQRCTCTDRVLVHRSRKDELVAALMPLVRSLRFGDPEDPASFAGPMSTVTGRERFEAALATARAAGADPLVLGGPGSGGNYMHASLHLLPEGVHEILGYTDTELFGPDVGIESFADDDEAIAVLQKSRFGLANSVFTQSEERFERFYRETQSGILNCNRSTNQASPRLPFGGLGKSGNYRPAGSHAARNVVAAVAVQENVVGRIAVHPKLADFMPPPELDRLAARHAEEEALEAQRDLLSTPRPMQILLPEGGQLPKSNEWLRRLYAADRVVREKKPPVFDHLRSAGPWLVSVDDAPLSVLDGMSQTATLCGGFAEDRVVRGYTEGEFGDALVRVHDPAVDGHLAATAFATVLRQMVPGLSEVAFANSGAEANEKALALAHANCTREGARKVLSFEGSFHGRTLLALSATFNPAKRGAFEIAGYEGTFAPYPRWPRPGDPEPMAPSGFYAAAGSGDVDGLAMRFGDREEDPLLADEVASLCAVARELATGEYFAVVIEPMQSEGGDRFATTRFYRALRLLTRHLEVPLIFDEVQTGFGLGGPFAWHTRFQLVNVRGQPDFPDAVVFAKRAQLGVCMSNWVDGESTSAQPASMIRGRMHAEMVATSHAAERVQKLVEQKLSIIAQGFPHLVGEPRACGFAFAFDLPSASHLNAYLGQRFWRGAVVFGAGTRTVRYRLSDSYLSRDIDLLFESVRRSLAWLDAHPGAQPPTWEDRADRAPAKAPERSAIRIRSISGTAALDFLPAILDIEYRVYEPVRRTAPAKIRAALEHSDCVATIAEVEEDGEFHFVGFAIGQPLEQAASHEEGPDRDAMLGKNNTLYSLSLTVAREYQGHGIGRKLKEEQLLEASRRTATDGTPRYRFVTGRNRVGHTAAMTHLNRAYGAHLVCVLTGQYEDPEGQAIYYRIPLAPYAPLVENRDKCWPQATASLAHGLSMPFAEPPEGLAAAERRGLLFGPAVNKLTVMNYATPAIVRALEWASALVPKLPHMYLTSCRDELVDKSLRILRTHRPKAQVAIGLDGGYLGHTTAAARSISDPRVHQQGPRYFDWPRVPHPEGGIDATRARLHELVEASGGGDRVLGLFVESVQERTGKALDAAMMSSLRAITAELGVPLVLAETAAAFYRSGQGAFASSGWNATPDILIWWGGGQTGYLHVGEAYRVGVPLAMVSTWDGDELSLVRDHHHLRAARQLDLAPAQAAWDRATAELERAGLPTRGLGLYRVIDAGARAEVLAHALSARGLAPRRFANQHLALIPSLDRAAADATALLRVLPEVL